MSPNAPSCERERPLGESLESAQYPSDGCRRLPYLHDHNVCRLGTDISNPIARTGRKQKPGTRPVERLFGPIYDADASMAFQGLHEDGW